MAHFNGYSETSDRFQDMKDGMDQRRADREAAMKRGPVCSCGISAGGKHFTDDSGQSWTVCDPSCPAHRGRS